MDTFQTFGKIVVEDENNYIGFGREFHAEASYNYGIYALEFDKYSGVANHFTIYDIDSTVIFFGRSNQAYFYNNDIYFLTKSIEKVFINRYSVTNQTLEVIDSLKPSFNVLTSFLGDFQRINESLYIHGTITYEDNSKDFYLYEYNMSTRLHNESIFETISTNENAGKIYVDSGSVFIFSNDQENKFLVNQIDKEGNFINLYTSSEKRYSSVNGLYQINSSEYLATNTIRMLINGEFHYIPTILKFDIEQKKVIWEKQLYSNEYWRSNQSFPNIILSIEEDGFITSGKISKPFYSQDSLITLGVIAKMNLDGTWSWRKEYYYLSDKGSTNEFNDIIITSDDKYLCYGSSIYSTIPVGEEYWSQSWAVKLNPDGSIVGDSSTSIDVISTDNYYNEIEIRSNLTQSEFMILQKDIDDITYRIFDSAGNQKDFIHLENSFQTYYYNTEAYPTGSYYIIAYKNRQKVYSGKIVKI